MNTELVQALESFVQAVKWELCPSTHYGYENPHIYEICEELETQLESYREKKTHEDMNQDMRHVHRHYPKG